MPDIKSILELINRYENTLVEDACRIDKNPIVDKDGGRTLLPKEVFAQVQDKQISVSAILGFWFSLQGVRKALEDN